MKDDKGRDISPVFPIVRDLVRFFYREPEIVGAEHLPDGAAVVVGNHAQMNGPIIAELYFPGDRWTWCAGEMLRLREVPAYAYADFWSRKPRSVRWFYRILSYLIAPLSVAVLGGAHTIGVCRDSQVLTTYRETVRRLQEGAKIILFPDKDEQRNAIVYAFQEGFVDVARVYHRRTGRALPFVPMYIAPRLGKVVIGEPMAFDPDAPIEAERRRVCDAMAEAITRMAEALPPHVVVPYPNIPKKDYPMNRREEVN